MKQPNLTVKLVVNSLITPDKNIQLQLSQTKAINDTNIYLINNAIINIFENEVFLGELVNIDNGLYKLNYNPTADKKYTININYNYFAPAKGTCTIPDLVEVDIEKFSIDNLLTINTELIRNISFTIKDPPNTKNYYEIKFFYDKELQEEFYYAGYSNITEPVILSESNLDYSPNSLFFSDQLFNGLDYKMKFKIEGGAYYYDIQGHIVPSNIYMRFRSVSKEYYLYRKYWTRHIFNQNTDEHFEDPLTLLFQGEPLPMYTNIENGYGIFAGYSECVKEIKYVGKK